VPEVAEHALEDTTHGAATADDGDGDCVGLDRQLGSQGCLVFPARAQQDAEEGLDFPTGKTHFLSAAAAVLQDLALALWIANPQLILPLVCGDLGYDRHTAGRDLQQLMVESVDHGAKEGERPRRWL
jgi:hypothetical protein